MSNHQHVGFIGVGSITAAVVNGLCSKQAIPTIHLSPRSEDVSKALAAKFSNVHRATSNVEVISKSQIVVLAMRPEQLKAALSGLTFRPDQTVVSFVATVTLAEIAKLVAPASQVCRVTPLTFIEKRRGPIVMAPALASVNTLFDGLGDVLVAETEEHMMAFGCAASLLSTFLELEHTVAQWLVATGVKPTVASQYVRSMFAGLANSAQETQNMALMTMAENNETPSGLNERVRVALRNAGMFTRVESVLSELASLSLAPSSDV
jgi:pyrroline-5-carboxylate reductase